MTRKSFLSPFYAKFTLINSISYDPENGSKCYPKTLKNGAQNGPKNPENGTKKWLDTLIKQASSLKVFGRFLKVLKAKKFLDLARHRIDTYSGSRIHRRLRSV